MKQCLSIIAVALLLACPGFAQNSDADLLARIEKLESELQSLKVQLGQPRECADNADTNKPASESQVTPQVSPAIPGAELARRRQIYGLSSWTLLDKIAGERTVVGGYADIEYRSFDGGSGKRTFNQQRYVIGAASRLTDDIFFSSELETEKAGPQNNQKDGEIKVEQAWLEYRLAKSLNFRGGVVLVPFGRLNVFHDSPILDLTDRPLVDRLIIPTTWSESAMGFQGSVNSSDESILTYELYLMNGFNNTISGSKGLRDARGSETKDNNSNKAMVGRVGYSPKLGVELGVSGYTGKYDTDNKNSLSMLGADLLYTKGPFELRGEWVKVNIERDSAAIASGIPAGMDGYYLEAAYHFFPERLRLTNPDRFGQSTFTGVVRYDSVDPDEGVLSSNDVKRLTLGVNFRPIEAAVFKLEYQWINEAVSEIDNDGFVASAALSF
ncbi:MAG: porin [Armatimonadota bacterium]|nr:porin [Armatimonadota bacterium]